jgi:hypothetical protein
LGQVDWPSRFPPRECNRTSLRKTPLPGYSRALLTSGASSTGATVICTTHPGRRSIEGGGPKSLNAPGPGCHQRVSEYGLHLTGVTSIGVPALELIQPVAVRRHGHRIAYGAPRPSVTCTAMSSSNGALSIGFQSYVTRGIRIALFPIQSLLARSNNVHPILCRPKPEGPGVGIGDRRRQ